MMGELYGLLALLAAMVTCILIIRIALRPTKRDQNCDVRGEGNYVIQSGARSGGDIIGGNKGKGKDKPCPYCGGR